MQYELENTGELTFYQRMAVKQMLENLQLTEQYDTQIALPEIRAEMRQADQTVQILKGRPSIAQAVIALAGSTNEGLRLFPGFPAHLMHMAAAAIARRTAPNVQDTAASLLPEADRITAGCAAVHCSSGRSRSRFR